MKQIVSDSKRDLAHMCDTRCSTVSNTNTELGERRVVREMRAAKDESVRLM